MTPFRKAFIPNEEIVSTCEEMLKKGIPPDVVAQASKAALECQYFLNDEYQVSIFDENKLLLHLSIKRRDREAIHDWRKLQQIKNELVGPENEGVELYPAESRLVDGANQYHLFVFKEPGKRFDFGFRERLATDKLTIGKSKQRPF